MQVFGVESLYCRENATKKVSFRRLFHIVLGTLLGTWTLDIPVFFWLLVVDCASDL
jgi:hypothetical protein